MTFIITPSSPYFGGGDFQYRDPLEYGERGPLRHFLIGTPQRIRATLRLLHARRYVDSHDWSQLMPIGADGLLIRPTPQEVYAYLQLPPWRD